MKSFLFLDFDGVLNFGSHYRHLQMAQLKTTDAYGTLFDEKCVQQLTKIIENTDAEIVVMSSWRFIHNLQTLKQLMHRELSRY